MLLQDVESGEHSHDHEGHDDSHGHSHGHKHGGEEDSINLRGAIIHVLGDFVQSIGVAIAGALIWWKQVGSLPLSISSCWGWRRPLHMHCIFHDG